MVRTILKLLRLRMNGVDEPDVEKVPHLVLDADSSRIRSLVDVADEPALGDSPGPASLAV